MRPRALLIGYVQSLLGDDEAAARSFQTAAFELEDALREQPDNEKLHSALGITNALLGRRDEAIRAGRRGMELVPLETQPWFGLVHVEDMAWIHAILGEHDKALELLETLLSMPSFITIPMLEIDPRWESVRDETRFDELRRRFGSTRTGE